MPDKRRLPEHRDRDRTHIWHLTIEEWVKKLEEAGFCIVYQETYPKFLKFINFTETMIMCKKKSGLKKVFW